MVCIATHSHPVLEHHLLSSVQAWVVVAVEVRHCHHALPLALEVVLVADNHYTALAAQAPDLHRELAVAVAWALAVLVAHH